MIESLPWTKLPPEACRGGTVSFGNFDGVHRGHAYLMQQLRGEARELRGPAVAVTFDPHPLQLLRPEQFQPLLTTARDRAELLKAQGVDGVLILQTTRDLLELSAADFFNEVIRKRLQARALVEGVNFGFGKNREGNTDTLAKFCLSAGMNLVVVPPLVLDGQVVSSSRVRGALQQGDVREAIRLLDRPYRLRGTVGRGQQRGRTIGFPTANLENVETLVPGDGVYAVRVYWKGSTWSGAANLGPNPTFGEQARKIEVHLIGFSGELSGEVLAVDFFERLRDTRPFSGVNELVEQLRKDVARAAQLTSSNS